MTKLVVDVAVNDGESLTNKIAQLIANPRIRRWRDEGQTRVLRNMRTERDHTKPNIYKITFSYELEEEEQYV